MHNNEVGLFGLLETKVKNNAFLRISNNFTNWCVSTNNGYHNGGRIWILWKPSLFRVHFLEYNAQFIHFKVEVLANRQAFYCTMVYAFNGLHETVPLWNCLKRLSLTTRGPWAVAGDFNCVLSVTERIGGNVSQAEIEPFKECLEECGLLDIYGTGALYTWNNKQHPEAKIYSRLDRFLINKEWSDAFPEASAHFHSEGLFD
ncbi:hypothetical protein vseg_016024 [Gypsophila vaccaria]